MNIAGELNIQDVSILIRPNAYALGRELFGHYGALKICRWQMMFARDRATLQEWLPMFVSHKELFSAHEKERDEFTSMSKVMRRCNVPESTLGLCFYLSMCHDDVAYILHSLSVAPGQLPSPMIECVSQMSRAFRSSLIKKYSEKYFMAKYYER